MYISKSECSHTRLQRSSSTACLSGPEKRIYCCCSLDDCDPSEHLCWTQDWADHTADTHAHAHTSWVQQVCCVSGHVFMFGVLVSIWTCLLCPCSSSLLCSYRVAPVVHGDGKRLREHIIRLNNTHSHITTVNSIGNLKKSGSVVITEWQLLTFCWS